MDRRPELRRAMTLKEQLSTPAEPAIRDFLRIPDDDDDDGAEDRPCTLMDAIDRDVRGEGGSGGAINCRPLRHRLWVRRAAGAWHATGSTAKPPRAVASRASPRSSYKYHPSPGEGSVAVAFTRAPSPRAVVDDDEENDVEEEDGHNDEPPPVAAASTSLMALLEQTDIHLEADEDGGVTQCGMVDVNDEDGHGDRHEEEEEEEAQVCCVCMVRHKGAAFIPCGHTFCRLCSRELRHARGNCPLCNVFIQDILQIF
ncbi:uncharacterized protein LOC119272657 [Triticum dicoccoides]|uniref:uncharacterized protein LOC119272657 n=1 Tax=Triticum dicoccoides TaxID=85692 RepID=UPI00188E7C3E|nr:uncharacterized protein LOC119272657 [Triticum dicoccoides]